MNNLSPVTDNLKSKFKHYYFSTLSTGFIVVFSFFKFLKKEIYNKSSVEIVDNNESIQQRRLCEFSMQKCNIFAI